MHYLIICIFQVSMQNNLISVSSVATDHHLRNNSITSECIERSIKGIPARKSQDRLVERSGREEKIKNLTETSDSEPRKFYRSCSARNSIRRSSNSSSRSSLTIKQSSPRASQSQRSSKRSSVACLTPSSRRSSSTARLPDRKSSFTRSDSGKEIQSTPEKTVADSREIHDGDDNNTEQVYLDVKSCFDAGSKEQGSHNLCISHMA